MRRMSVLSVFCILTAALFAQTQNDKAKEPAAPKIPALSLTPLNVKTGLWQMTETISWVGLPPQMQTAMNNGVAINYKSCVKPADLTVNPWAEGSSGHTCRWTTLSSNGTDMEVQGDSCDLGKDYGLAATVAGTIHVIDSQDGTGSFDIVLTGNGQTMHGHASYTGQWVAATCPAAMD